MDFYIGNRYQLGRKIGKGAFGDIYIGKDTVSGNDIAIKLEPITNRHQQLQLEYKIYRLLHGGIGIPCVYYYGSDGNYNILVMELCGPNLEELFNFCNRHFSLKTVCMLAQEMLLRVQYMHNKNFIHRDLKPENFVVGIHKHAGVIHLLDFGLSKRYRNPVTKVHIPYRDNKHLTGTPRYASLGNHLGIEQSRRDDLESIGFILVYFLRGNLPWQGIKINNKKEKYAKIMEYKKQIPFEDLCHNLPIEFQHYFEYCRSLRFDDCPDYLYLQNLFTTIMKKNGFLDDGVYDWMSSSMEASVQFLPGHCLGPDGGMRQELRFPAFEELRKCMTAEEAQQYSQNLLMPNFSQTMNCRFHTSKENMSGGSPSNELHSVYETSSLLPSLSNEESRSFPYSNLSATSRGMVHLDSKEKKETL